MGAQVGAQVAMLLVAVALMTVILGTALVWFSVLWAVALPMMGIYKEGCVQFGRVRVTGVL